MHDVNLDVFDFDYDLTWWAFVLDPYERVYSRFGGTGDGNCEERLSVPGLKHTLRLVLARHKLQPPQPLAQPQPVRRPNDLFTLKGKCLHCHQVNEAFYRQEKLRAAAFDLEKVRFLPIPEDLGLTMSLDAGNILLKVAKDSPADQAGLREGDVLRTVRGTPILSQGDLMWTLKYAPQKGPLPVHFERAGREREVTLELSAGWKKPDLSWRRSVKKLKK
jgi:hypothetical protein